MTFDLCRWQPTAPSSTKVHSAGTISTFWTWWSSVFPSSPLGYSESIQTFFTSHVFIFTLVSFKLHVWHFYHNFLSIVVQVISLLTNLALIPKQQRWSIIKHTIRLCCPMFDQLAGFILTLQLSPINTQIKSSSGKVEKCHANCPPLHATLSQRHTSLPPDSFSLVAMFIKDVLLLLAAINSLKCCAISDV